MIALGTVYFYLCAALAVAGAIATVAAKNPIRGAMGLLLMVLSTAGLFLALHAQFLAAIQLIVFAGAIVVLFLFVIMILGPSATPPSDNRGRIPRTVGAVVFGATGLAAMGVLITTAPERPEGEAALLPSPPSDFGTIDSIGRSLFTEWLLPFELTSALLMVAILGAVAVARGRSKSDQPAASPEATLKAENLPKASEQGAPRSPGGITREAHQ